MLLGCTIARLEQEARSQLILLLQRKERVSSCGMGETERWWFFVILKNPVILFNDDDEKI